MPGRELRRMISNPLALGLLGLSLAITLWGSAGKVSSIDAACGHSHAPLPVAKLWIEHRFGFAAVSGAATAPRSKSRIYAQAGVDALIVPPSGIYLQAILKAAPVTARPRAIPFFHSAIPLRSPPSLISL